MKLLLLLLKNRDKVTDPLFNCGLIHLLLALVLLTMLPFEQRQVLGINLWIKPLKFALSIGIYCLSWVLILPHLPDKKLERRFVRFTIFAMSFEILAIVTQAARAELSHFNQSGWYNIAVYGLMGIVITAQTLFSLYLGITFFKNKPRELNEAMTWAIRLGIVISAIFALQGGFIGQKMAHTVGAADGGAGIPFLNWSKDHGDLRIAHFFGLHALQIIPVFVWINKIKRAVPVMIFGLLYFLLVGFLFYHALLGRGY
ncbi:MAG: hypothetical protein WKF66_13310 [Pedobacter sp.]